MGNFIDLTIYPAGAYTLEIYYQLNGGDKDGTCIQQRYDNAGGLNYSADFIITTPLAIIFSSINGIVSDKGATIKWIVQNDIKIGKYEIEKSKTGLQFVSLGSLAANRSIATNSYLFTDVNPAIGTNFYRIKAYYDNGTVGLSRVFTIYFGEVGNALFIYANPSAENRTIRLAAVTKGNYQMSIVNNNGRVISSTFLNHDGNDKTVHMALPVTLSHGMYRLFLIDKYRFYKQSFLIR